ncbi:hypothetical protein CROQUDRAFT_130603 [Cronartium quercuum f. sp. fusiforme G11]|uniref:Uncharacterized protein n=1 Tax=Cronartium quercuum f. sp. fusiforme G11 TaxID=708437 RepID=A0A9P6TG54_9BASI|nr:hypothetical protein CROQUDRAFT_130603 [Cronartium quercuum f. sp. fusiforme G11]
MKSKRRTIVMCSRRRLGLQSLCGGISGSTVEEESTVGAKNFLSTRGLGKEFNNGKIEKVEARYSYHLGLIRSASYHQKVKATVGGSASKSTLLCPSHSAHSPSESGTSASYDYHELILLWINEYFRWKHYYWALSGFAKAPGPKLRVALKSENETDRATTGTFEPSSSLRILPAANGAGLRVRIPCEVLVSKGSSIPGNDIKHNLKKLPTRNRLICVTGQELIVFNRWRVCNVNEKSSS